MAAVDSYVVATGQPIYGGREPPATSVETGLPSWAPASGTVADVGLNTIRSIDSFAVPMNWCGGVYLPWLGVWGSLIVYGEGHTDGARNSIFRYDFYTRLWSRIKDAAPIFNHASDNYVGDPDTGYMWASATDNTVQVGQSAACHLYANMLALPPNLIPGTPMGALVKMGQTGIAYTGSKDTKRLHVLAIGEQLWTNPFDIVLPAAVGNGCTLYDSLRNRVVMFGSVSFDQSFTYWDINTPNAGRIATNGVVEAYYANAHHMIADDVYVLARNADSYTAKIRVIDPKTNTVYTPPVIGDAPPVTASDQGTEGGWDLVQASRGFLYFKSTGFSYFLQAPADPRTGTWVWSKVELAGTVRPNATNTHLYGRTRYVPPLKGLSYPAGYDSPMQLIGVTVP